MTDLPIPLSLYNPVQFAQFSQWFSLRKQNQRQDVAFIDFDSSQQWSFDDKSGDLIHSSARFFSVRGLNVRIIGPTNLSYTQPFIFQPEVGILGLICKVFDGELKFLLQAKSEPGNKGGIQLSPTVQATKSNFTRVHGGSSIKYLDYFTDKTKGTLIVDSLQPEQSDRFMRKRNRNIVLLVDDDLIIDDDFYWLSLMQIKILLTVDNLIAMDTRSVISNLCFDQFCIDAFLSKGSSKAAPISDSDVYNIQQVEQWLIQINIGYKYTYEHIGLGCMSGWILEKDRISQISQGAFSVKQCLVQSNCREVKVWDQPIIVSERVGLIGLVVRRSGSLVELLCHARRSIGSINNIEISPTLISDHTADTASNSIENWFLETLNTGSVLHRSFQSEEGGRFFHYENEYVIVELTQDAIHRSDLKWIDLRTVLLCSHRGMVNMELRSMISLLIL